MWLSTKLATEGLKHLPLSLLVKRHCEHSEAIPRLRAGQAGHLFPTHHFSFFILQLATNYSPLTAPTRSFRNPSL
jgi:hypothetical protein